uniref:Ig-like domain-containing protein n=1 Tax=Mastacembelus armatus TaxID=205130 RepID=A0A7N8WZN8_9TELE
KIFLLLPLTFDLICECVWSSLSLCVSSTGTFVVNVTQSSYQAEENHDITLDWTFTTTAHMSLSALHDGRVRLHVSRLRTEDSGLYLCSVETDGGADYNSCHLKVTGKLVQSS